MIYTKRISALMIVWLVAFVALGQMVSPVHWQSSARVVGDKSLEVTLRATIDEGWHMYATDLPAGGPRATTVEWTTTSGLKLNAAKTRLPKAQEGYDPNYDMTLRWWSGTAQLVYTFDFTGEPNYRLEGAVNYSACNDRQCIAPTSEAFKFTGKSPAPAAQEPVAEQDSVVAAVDSVATDSVAAPADELADTWAPVTAVQGAEASTDDTSLWWLFVLCVGGGLLALLTPCVWPIIPMTVSFFMKRGTSRRESVGGALAYAASIIVIYVALGLLVTALFGASTLNAIATSAVANLIFFALLVLFALSFFGAFELQLPSSWAGKMDVAAERTTGLLSILFMAFTLVIVSFSCTGPIIGTLLVEAAGSGSRVAPAVGMLGFALGLAVPFGLFALFPSWMKKLPKSGNWMGVVKVVLGFVELALSLKFLSVADLAYGWHILDREVFLALWIAIFGLLGLYLLGLFRFESDGASSQPSIGVTRFMLALASLAFTAYLIPGLWGAPLRGTSAFVPPLSTQDFVLGRQVGMVYNDYDAALQAAAQQGLPVFIDFTGYGCVNCRKMEGAVLDRDEVKRYIEEHFVSAQLIVDDKTPLAAPRTVKEGDRSVTLSTQGDLWSYLQRHKFGANSQPYYVVVDAQGRLLSGPVAYDENVEKFMNFLKQATNEK